MASDLRYRKQAAAAIEARMTELRTTAAGVARRAGVDPKTLRALLAGESWPRSETRARLEAALGWGDGEIARQAMAGAQLSLEAVPTADLLAELCRRADAGRI